ncbi:hypothetical protein ACOKWN_003873 [Vibrio parahaemolyticus]
MDRTLTITAWETKQDYADNKPEVYIATSDSEANEVHSDFENRGYWLVTTTNDSGKLIR